MSAEASPASGAKRRSPVRILALLLLLALLALVLVLEIVGQSGRLEGVNYSPERGPYLKAGVRSEALPADGAAYRIILVGDTGEPIPNDPVLAALGRWAVPEERAAVVLLGDNLYQEGLHERDRERGEAVLAQQLEATRALRVFVPGNHDWGFDREDQTGFRARAQQAFLLDWPDGPVDFLPRDGCTGPAVRELLKPGDGLKRGVAVMAIDWMPWWSPFADAGGCPAREFEDAVDAAFAGLENHFVVVASHFPTRTGGPHAGLSRGFIKDLFVDWYHLVRGDASDVDDPRYMQLSARIETALAEHRPLIYAAGHDHSLQLFEADEVSRMNIVSGAGSVGKVSTVTDVEGTIFAYAAPGFVVVDFLSLDGADTPVVRVVGVPNDEPIFQMRIP